MTSVKSSPVTSDSFFQRLAELGPVFADRAASHDLHETFVSANYADLKRHAFFSAGVPTELGGGGLTFTELCRLLREMAAFCPSTALVFAMHQHLTAAAVWRYRRGLPGEPLLRRIAAEQLVLVTTGGHDWLSSTGETRAVEGGYRVSGRKAFSSGCEIGDLLLSSMHFAEPDGPSVIHFAVPMRSEGISLMDDWHTLGMRGTGSRTVLLENVFVPEAAVSLKRPAGQWHPVWATVLGVAMPLIMSVYLGAAEAAARIARDRAQRPPHDPGQPYLLGELTNALTTVELAVQDLVRLNAEHTFEPTLPFADAVLVRKTLAANAAVQVAHKAMEVCGGVGFYHGFGLEKLLRDIQAAPYHPLPEKAQQRFSGRLALGLDPV